MKKQLQEITQEQIQSMKDWINPDAAQLVTKDMNDFDLCDFKERLGNDVSLRHTWFSLIISVNMHENTSPDSVSTSIVNQLTDELGGNYWDLVSQILEIRNTAQNNVFAHKFRDQIINLRRTAICHRHRIHEMERTLHHWNFNVYSGMLSAAEVFLLEFFKVGEDVDFPTQCEPEDRNIIFKIDQQEVAKITSNGVMEFSIDASDENANKFVECFKQIFDVKIREIRVTKIKE